jgi:hypothetical protein
MMKGTQRKPEITQMGSAQASQLIQCCYMNHTTRFQVVRIAKIPDRFFERVVPPQAEICFEADLNDHLEIHAGEPISAILSDKIPCHRFADDSIAA